MAGTRRKIRIAVTGLGRIGWDFHCKEISQHPDFELAAVQDVDPARCREAEQVYRVPAFVQFSDMLSVGDLEAVTIATPTHLHKPMAQEALRSGYHVLLEKPMASDSREAEAIVRSAARRGRVLTVYQPRRAAARFQHLRKILASGAIGQIYHVRISGYNYVRRDDWQSLRRYGGGMLNNYGAHSLDQLLQLVGYDVKRVFCCLRVVASLGDAEDVVKVVVETKKGVLGEVDINQASAVPGRSLQAWGTNGVLSLSSRRGEIHIKRFAPESLAPKRLDRSLASRDRKYPTDEVPFREETVSVDPSLQVDVYADFADAIRSGRPPLVRPHEPLAVMRLIDRCREDSGRIRRMGAPTPRAPGRS